MYSFISYLNSTHIHFREIDSDTDCSGPGPGPGQLWTFCIVMYVYNNCIVTIKSIRIWFKLECIVIYIKDSFVLVKNIFFNYFEYYGFFSFIRINIYDVTKYYDNGSNFQSSSYAIPCYVIVAIMLCEVTVIEPAASMKVIIMHLVFNTNLYIYFLSFSLWIYLIQISRCRSAPNKCA